MSKKKNSIVSVEHDLAQEFIFGPNTPCEVDKLSGARYVNLSITYPDKTPGLLCVLRAKNEGWQVNKSIKSIVINYEN